jgi:SAM-dependent methyltransferase
MRKPCIQTDPFSVLNMKCRHCNFEIDQPLVNLGCSPPSNAYLTFGGLSAPETYWPLRVSVCTNCWLIQTEVFHRTDELFDQDYAYFSSVSITWLKHAAAYARMITERLGLTESSLVLEIAANDGYLLKNFLAAGIPCLGIEPTDSTARVAEEIGIPIRREFFGSSLGTRLASEGKRADLIIGNNVYAHVPDINDFTAGIKAALKPHGVVTLEFPHAMRLLQQTQFDTIYHEHFSYLSAHSVRHIFESVGLRIWHVEELPTHGGSLRIYGCHSEDDRAETAEVSRVLTEEYSHGLMTRAPYREFQRHTEVIKNDLLTFLIDQKRAGKLVAAYGAAAKGNTLLNYAGVKPDLLPFVCDAGPAKQGKYLPGSRIPIVHPNVLTERRPDFILILPWNIADEITTLHGYAREWGAKFVVAVPELHVLS